MGNKTNKSQNYKKKDLIKKLCKYSCKIKIKKNIFIGFFCNLPFPDEYYSLKVLIIYENLYDLNDIKKNNDTIKITLNDRKKTIPIKIDNSTIIYVSKEFNLTVIQIREKENEIKNFLEVDNNINEKDSQTYLNDNYFDEKIYILNYSKKNNLEIFDGIFDYTENNYLHFISHDEIGLLDSFNLLLNNNLEIIGIGTHLEQTNKNLKGYYIKYFINEFYKNFKIYNTNSNIKNEITIKYKIDENAEKIKIFNEIFVNNNRDKCKIIIEGEEREICSDLKINESMKNKKILEIKLKEYESIHNMMGIFGECTSLISLPDIDKWNMSNVIILRSIFYNCSSLTSLPDISKWNTKNIINMRGIFNGCSSLSSLPDISKWNIENVNDINCLFCECSSLTSLPDISNWNMTKFTKLINVFYGCSSLKFLPDISKWNIKNVTDISGIFLGCKSLVNLPDISKWDTGNVSDMSFVFGDSEKGGCSSLLYLPDISKWNTSSLQKINGIFYDCHSLLYLPDLSKWNFKNVTEMNYMFYHCFSLSHLPDISKWNINDIEDKELILENCINLLNIPLNFI